jgi:serine phosphatase RsbU (regulator of sigma subunit)/Tfp pilus assembly protein PilF
MKNLIYILFLLPLMVTAQLSADQQALVDSLRQVIKTAKHDTSIVKAWEAWDVIIYLADPELDFVLLQKIDNLCAKNLKKNLNRQEKVRFLNSRSFALNNIGIIYDSQGDLAKAIEYYTQSLKVYEELRNKQGTASTLNNIGGIYREQGDNTKAMEYFTQSLKILEEIGDKDDIALSLINIGNIYQEQGDNTKAMEYSTKSLKLTEEIGDKKGMANALMRIGGIYQDLNDYAKAIEYYTQSLKIWKEIGSKKGIANSLMIIGGVYQDLGDYVKSLEYSQQALRIGQEIGSAVDIRTAAKTLWEVNKKLGNHKESLEMYELFISTRDSIDSEANQKAVIQQEYKYNYEKQKALDDAGNDKKVALEKEKQKKQFIILVIIIIASCLVLLLLIIIYRRLRITKKQKVIIEEQKDEVELAHRKTQEQKEVIEEAHKEITDSINYAERIQRSFLATEDLLNENLDDYFVFFQPKEAVSGDFYWAGKLANNNFALVNADSTGHGVPGAIMSILNISSIEKAIEKGLTNTSDIFNDTRKTIIERLKKDGSAEGGKDGMDASIISFDKENNKFTYTAAQNPIWIIRDKELIQIKPEKMPIGKHDNDAIPFVGGEFKTQKGDIIYTLTDGYQDQFGGDKGKKFMVKKMREYFLSISHLPMQEQHDAIKTTFSSWKGDLEQIDDVCVIGVRI